MTFFTQSTRRALAFSFVALFGMSKAQAQHFPSDDPVIRQMWEIGVEQSQTKFLAHQLIDVIGPRLAGSPNLEAAQSWIMGKYSEWGVTVEKEQYGTWNGWQQGILHVDMMEPRVRSLEGYMLAWSPPTDGPVTAEAVLPPADLTDDNLQDWLGSLDGKIVMMSAPERMCRAKQELEKYARPETVERLDSLRLADRRAFNKRIRPISMASMRAESSVLESAGIVATFTSRWSGGWGVNKVLSTNNKTAAGVDLSCEDYGLLYRLIDGGITPVIRLDVQSEDLGVVPQFNVIASLPGTEKPDEYVLLTAHLDSWHSASGATDNGTGTITMLEAMRILKTAYPNPKRTILIGHWGGEEMGMIGSSAFREDHPEVVAGLQVAFNQDNGTWRYERLEGQGMQASSEFLPKWLGALPTEITSHIVVEVPGAQNNGGSDHTAFLCAGAPSFRLQSPYDEYRQYTWHTNRDTYDKIVFDDLAENATTAAMLAYMASEDPDRFGREKANLPVSARTGKAKTWAQCRPARREPR